MVNWENLKVIPIKRAGKWVSGVILQENEEGKRRIKLFKGIIKEDGSLEMDWKGEKIRVSMIQRFNIPSKKYWEELEIQIKKLLKDIEGRETDEEQESLRDFV